MKWQIGLEGRRIDIDALREVAPFWGYQIESSEDGFPTLSGGDLDTCQDDREIRERAVAVLRELNGLANSEFGNHKAVSLSDRMWRVREDGGRDTFLMLAPAVMRIKGGAIGVVTDPDGTAKEPPPDPRAEFFGRIKSDPKLREIIGAMGVELSWQKLRVASEKVVALVDGRGRGNNYNALVKHRYAEQEQIDQFKANVEDPRLGGTEAVHGVARGPLKGTKMSVEEGRAFVVGLLRSYVDRQVRS